MNDQITAEVIKDSIYKGNRLITIKTIAPKYLDAECLTHQMISQNSSSDRAIPFATMLKQEPFIMEDIRQNEKGMQGYNQVEDEIKEGFQNLTLSLHELICTALYFYKDKVHKQHLNRYLLPFTLQSKLMTANIEQFYYFLGLRNAPGADPAIQELARKIKYAIEGSEPQELKPGQWHLPFVLEEEIHSEHNCKLSVARCARISYNNFSGEFNPLKDIELADDLLTNKHFSCFEHQATPMGEEGWCATHYDTENRRWSGNFCEWTQYRQTIASWNQ